MSQQSDAEWEARFQRMTVEAFKTSFLDILAYRLGKHIHSATKYDKFLSVAYSVMERMVERWITTQDAYKERRPKRVYYLSMEWLLGRSLANSLINLGLYDTVRVGLAELGLDLADVLESESDAGLGNGGLGRLAACFMDSMATLGIPVVGYGLRYEYGLFNQKISNGEQVETPDKWLALPHPWETVRPEYILKVQFGGSSCPITNRAGTVCGKWEDTEEEQAMPYDIPIPGYHTGTVNTLRLWSARATDEFNLEYFNHGNYIRACEDQVAAENLTRVLYPSDQVFEGKELRLKQEYFLVAASMEDIILRFFKEWGFWRLLPEKVAIQLNDTHPALAMPELMRILLDREGLDWETAWDLTVRTIAYTNHTMLPEALEEWPVSLLEHILPRHLEIIYEINLHFLKRVASRYPGDVERLRRMSIIAEDGVKRVRMAHLAVVGSHSVNGVSELHTRLVRETLLRDFVEFWPEKFNNKTNGITPRRWLRQSNPNLSALITESIGDGWVKELAELRQLEPLADDAAFRDAWRQARKRAKEPLIALARHDHNLVLPATALFDVQVKRIHEYKRQLLFALYIIASYLQLKEQPHEGTVPRVCLFGGKAAPGYERAKRIIHLIANMSDMINHDPQTKDLLRVHFLPNYRVSLAEKLIPAADLSEQISMAGMEASGTSNMKFALNGALTIGTLDGANVEIKEEVGDENIFIFGHTDEQIRARKEEGYDPAALVAASPLLQRVLHLLKCDFFCPGEPGAFRPLFDDLITGDYYFLLGDFADYLACQQRVATAFLDPEHWTRMSILNVARCGKFSSDRTITEYARDIWHADAVPVAIEETAGVRIREEGR